MPNTQSTPPTAANNTAPSQPGAEPRLIRAVSADGASPQFKIPVSSQAIQSVESVDLDLVLTTTTGEKIILQQGALQAATAPDSKIVFQNGDSITAADQIKKLGVLKPVEGGSFRLKSGDASPAVAELVTGDGFGLGKELQDTMSQLTETSKQLEKVLQTLSTATLSNTADDSKPITAGPGTGTGVQKITPQSENKFASPSPGSPPQPEVEKFTSNNTSNNTDSGNLSNIKITSTLRGLYGAPDTIISNVRVVDKIQSEQQGKEVLKAFSQASLREMLPSDPLQVRVSGSDRVALEPNGLAHNTLVMPGVLNASSIRFELPQGTVLPDGFQIAGQTFSGSSITIAAESLKDLSLAIQWKVADLDDSITKTDFQLGVKYLDDKGAELEQGRAPLTFTYGELKTIEDTVQLDGNSNTKIFLSAYGYSYKVEGDAADNNITAGVGNDYFSGGGGRDTLNGGAGLDTVDYAASREAVTVDVISGFGYGGDAEGDRLSNIEKFIGSSQATDTLSFQGTNQDAIINLSTGSAKVPDVIAFSGFENVIGGSGNDRMTGDGKANKLEGGLGNDTLVGGMGADTLDGGGGNNAVSYESSTQAVVVSLLVDAENTGGEATGDKLLNIQNLTGSNGADILTGNAYNNILFGGKGDDTLIGGEGADNLNGGDDIDTADYSATNQAVSINMVTGVGAGGHAQDDRLISIEKIAGSTSAEDTLNYADSKTFVKVSLADKSLFTGFENISGSNFNDEISGDANANKLEGGTGNDTLVGGAGSDTLTGGGGVDTASYAAATGAVTVSLASGRGTLGDADGDVLIGITNLIGGNGTDTMTGDAGDNSIAGGANNDLLVGGAGNDTLDGGAGGDIMHGGSGNDIYYVDVASGTAIDAIVELFNEGADTVQSSVNFTLGQNLENLTLSGKADGGNGNDLNNTIVGSNSASTLDGKDGHDSITGGNAADKLIGGLGDDTLDGGSGSDWVDYSAATNQMTVDLKSSGTSVVSFLIGTVDQGLDTLSNIENIKTGSGNDNISATGSSDIANTIYAGAGDDTVSGGDGADALYGEDGNDSLTGGAGTDSVYGGIGNDTLIGGSGGDVLYGGDGSDTLSGGDGNDTLYGGTGNDTYIVQDTTDVVVENSGKTINGTDTLQIKGISSINLSIFNAKNIEVVDLTADAGANTVKISSAGVQSLVGSGDSSVLKIALGTNDVITIESETGAGVSGGYDSTGRIYSWYATADSTQTSIAQMDLI